MIPLILPLSLTWGQDVASLRPSKANPSSTCRVGQDYFQSLLQRQKLPSLGSHAQIKAECVQSALQQVTAGHNPKAPENNFVRCHPETRALLEKQRDPCLSEEYSQRVHVSFEWVTSCTREFVAQNSHPVHLKNWVETYFQILGKESGLQVNVLSPTGAVGAAQLTEEFIQDFQKETLSELRTFLNSSTNASCRQLAAQFLTDENLKAIHNTCDQIDIKRQQPVLNMLIGFSHLKKIKSRILKRTFRNGKLFNLTPEERHKLEIKLVTMAYNLGDGALNIPVQLALKTYSETHPVTDATNFIQRVHEKIPAMKLIKTMKKGQIVPMFSTNRVEEMKNYLEKIETRYQKILAGAETKSCWQPQ